ncbi:SDR family NAD(P)-dependent oxidoreductase [Plantibacter cousiniae (nom. nud.)]|uniref:NAD(P)-dependent dehydrogenase, short-chain alcohol dehydrogenase family n=1 Tax=Plantibacter cousiniae (nom. nud.) TaxID=199709 RepID=A0ABY1LM62_9MICO|nr:SDR family NAD(P)-dependent oxidoreductase [Plantibacter cousiniae]SKC56880.1 NAD(P)-dependent dehydrogenase, short-chain alcohol dehydrogenase family [Plantibacter cousiniae]
MSARVGTVVLTGATSGIGQATALRLAGMTTSLVALGVETSQHAAPALDRIRRAGPAELHYVSADFTHLADVVRAAERVGSLAPSIDLLINDAGVPGARERIITSDGFERTLQVNALAPALFTRLLIPHLAEGARIVNVGSSAHRVEHFHFDDLELSRTYAPITAYARAKLAMVTWSSLLAEEEAGRPHDVVALCPGLNDTPLSAAMMGRIGGPASQGAELVLAASAAAVPSGSYLENGSVVSASADSLDPANRAWLATIFRERLSPFVVGRDLGVLR